MKYYKAFEMFKINNDANWAAPNWSLTKNFTVNFFKQSFKKLNYFRRVAILKSVSEQLETMLSREYKNYRAKPEGENIQHIDTTDNTDSIKQQLLLKASDLEATPESVGRVLLALKAAPELQQDDVIDIDFEIVNDIDDDHLLNPSSLPEVKFLNSAQRKLLKEAPNYDSNYSNPELAQLVEELKAIKNMEDVRRVRKKIIEMDTKLRQTLHAADEKIKDSSGDPDDRDFLDTLHLSAGCEEDLKVVISMYVVIKQFIELLGDDEAEEEPKQPKKKKKGHSSHSFATGEVTKDIFKQGDHTTAPAQSTGLQISNAFNNMAAGVGEKFHQAAIERFKKEGGLSFKNPASVAKIKEDKRYHIKEESDGTATVLGIYDPATKAWVGQSGTVTEGLLNMFQTTVKDKSWTAEDRVSITKKIKHDEINALYERAEYNAKEGLLRKVDKSRLGEKWDTMQKKLHKRWNYIYEMDKLKSKAVNLPPAKVATQKIASALDAVLDNKASSFVAPLYAGIRYADHDKPYFLLTISEGKILMAKRCVFENNWMLFKIIGELSTAEAEPNVLLIVNDYKKESKMEKDRLTLNLHNEGDNSYPLLLIYKDKMYSTVFEGGIDKLKYVSCDNLVITQLTKPELVKKIFNATKATISGFSANIKTDVDKDLIERFKKLFL